MAGSRSDTRAWDALVKKVGDLANQKVKVGILAANGGGDREPGSEMTLVEIAATHEFGSPAAGIPERSFLRDALAEFGEQARSTQARLARAIIADEMTIEQALGVLGEWWVAKIKGRIARGEGIPPPLAASTIRAKGSDRPLVDTGRLLASITWAIETGGAA